MRGAIRAANATGPGPHAITFSASTGTYLLALGVPEEDEAAEGDLDIRSSITITGRGAASTIIDGGAIDRVFDIVNDDTANNPTLVVKFVDVTIQNGQVTTEQGTGTIAGGGIAVRASTNTSSGGTQVTVQSSTVRDNKTRNGNGAAIHVAKATGGVAPALTLVDTTVADNTAGSTGAGTGNEGNAGGIECVSCSITARGTTVSGNVANGRFGGGGVMVVGPDASVLLSNSTISGNRAAHASGNGGGLLLRSSTMLVTLNNVTIAQNRAVNRGGGIDRQSGTLDGTNTLVALNISDANNNHNAVSAVFNGVDTTNIIGDVAGLSTLASNGGPTQTHALTGGPAVDMGTLLASVEPFDQRGSNYRRTANGKIDGGAFELQGQEPEIAVSEAVAGNIGDAGSFGFGTTTTGSSVTKTFTVANTGTADLLLSNLALPAGFSLVDTLPASIAPNGTGSIQVKLDAATAGIFTGELSFQTNDLDENPFNVTLTGSVEPRQTVQFSQSAPYQANEADVPGAVLRLTRSGDPGVTSQVRVSITGGTATAGADYLATDFPMTVTFGLNEGEKEVPVQIVQNGAYEAAETITFQVAAIGLTLIGTTNTATLSIADDEPLPSVTLTLGGSPIAEQSGVATVTATLSILSELEVVADLSFTGSATVTADYIRSGTAITVPAGSQTGALTLTAVGDLADEPDETIVVDVSSITNGVEATTQQVTATIADDDATPTVTLSLTGSPLAETNGVATVTATLSAPSNQLVTVSLGFGGTATLTSDYLRSDTSITIAPGSLNGSITLTGAPDALDEPDETIVVDITGATSGSELGVQQVTAVIADDDAPPLVTLASSAGSMPESGGAITVTAALSGPSLHDVTVQLGFGGTATVTTDYTRAGTAITIPAGGTSGSTTVTSVDDTLDEPDETIVVEIVSVTNATESGAQQVTATIVDDDGAPSLTLSLAGSPLAENGGVGTVTATLSTASVSDVTVGLTFGGTAAFPGDYLRSATSITVPAGSTSGSLTITALNDTVDELDETIVVDVTSVSNAAASGTQQLTTTITDDDLTPTLTLSATGSPLAENGGVATVTATLSAASASDLTVALTFGGTAAFPGDYLRSGTSITIPAGSTSGSLIVTGLNDALDEPDEMVVVEVAGPPNISAAGSQQVTVAITDDDPAPTVTLAATGSPISESGGGATLTATLSGPSSRGVIVDLAFGGSATLSTDFARSDTSITIPAGATTGTVTLTAINDTQVEPEEVIVVDIVGVTNGDESGSQHVIVVITDDDLAPLACSSAFKIEMQTQQVGPGLLRVVMRARAATGQMTGQLQSLRIESSQNAGVDLGPGVVTQFPSGVNGAPVQATLDVAGQPEAMTLMVRRLSPGPFMARLVVADGCGDWPTLVGGGANVP